MFVIQINFEIPTVSPDVLAAFDTAERAKPFLEIPGFTWKIWLHTEGQPKFGGIYCFDSRANAQAYLDGPIVARIRANPDYANVTTQLYAIAENPSRVTHAPVPFLARAAE